MASWIDAITLADDGRAFEALPGPAAFKHHVPWESMDGIELPAALDECVARDPLPLPGTLDREKYHDDRHFDFWLSGLKDYCRIRSALRRVERPARAGASSRVLDFGCASGRVLRHFLCQPNAPRRDEVFGGGGGGSLNRTQGVPGANEGGPDVWNEVWGCDINARHIEWITRHLGAGARVFQSTALPNLPIEDHFFDLVYAFSVFTHIDELETAWLLEVRRILKPGGVAYLSVHTDHTWRALNPERPPYGAIEYTLRQRDPDVPVTPETFRRPLRDARTVFKAGGRDVYNCNIFHTADYLRGVWGRFFEVREVIPDGATYQDVVVMAKPG